MNICLKILLLTIILFICSCSGHKKAVNDYDDVYNNSIIEKQYFKFREDDTSSSLYDEINGWLGIPYKYGGNTKNGVDCSGFVCQIYKSVYHINLERNSSAIFYKNCKRIDKRDMKEGDLIFFSTRKKSRNINHVGIFLKDDKFVHASSSKGVIINSLDKPYYQKNYICSGRVITR